MRDIASSDQWEVVDRRRHLRRRPRYTKEEVDGLRILQVQLWREVLYCLLSDHAMLCVPLNITPVVASAPLAVRYLWQLGEDRQSIRWTGSVVEEFLRLPVMLAHPGSVIMLPEDH